MIGQNKDRIWIKVCNKYVNELSIFGERKKKKRQHFFLFTKFWKGEKVSKKVRVVSLT